MSGEQEQHHIDARDVRPGDMIWNPYGGARGYAEVASEPRERPDGTVEFDCADGRTGHFGPQFRLQLNRAAMARRDAEREAAESAAPAEVVPIAGEIEPDGDSWRVIRPGREPVTAGTVGEALAALSEPEAGG